jgi:hypothetical protein
MIEAQRLPSGTSPKRVRLAILHLLYDAYLREPRQSVDCRDVARLLGVTDDQVEMAMKYLAAHHLACFSSPQSCEITGSGIEKVDALECGAIEVRKASRPSGGQVRVAGSRPLAVILGVEDCRRFWESLRADLEGLELKPIARETALEALAELRSLDYGASDCPGRVERALRSLIASAPAVMYRLAGFTVNISSGGPANLIYRTLLELSAMTSTGAARESGSHR